MSIGFAIFILVATVIVYVVVMKAIRHFWKTRADYPAENVAKACDSVIAIAAFLIPTALGFATWQYEKLLPYLNLNGSLLLAILATLWFLLTLAWTFYIRFNFIWSQPKTIAVGPPPASLRLIYWLTTVEFGLVVGLLYLVGSVVGVILGTHASGPNATSGSR